LNLLRKVYMWFCQILLLFVCMCIVYPFPYCGRSERQSDKIIAVFVLPQTKSNTSIVLYSHDVGMEAVSLALVGSLGSMTTFITSFIHLLKSNHFLNIFCFIVSILSISCAIIVLSAFPHQEPRFLVPCLIPMVLALMRKVSSLNTKTFWVYTYDIWLYLCREPYQQ
jgi:hypothetical protein